MTTISVLTLINQFMIGFFFFISGIHKVFNAERNTALEKVLETCEIPYPKYTKWWVATWEAVAGLGLVAVMLAEKQSSVVFLFAPALIIICLVAICTDGCRQVESWKPLNILDRINCFLYLPETYMMIILGEVWTMRFLEWY